jgi:predicted nucleic acid-binding protein
MDPLDLNEIPDNALLLVDTAPIIYVLERHATFEPVYRPLFDAHAVGRLRFAVTTITVVEVLTGPYKADHDELALRYRFVLESWQVVPLDIDLAESAARLRAETGLKLPDAVQLAAAIAVNAFALVTHDRDFAAVDWFPIRSGLLRG